MAIKAQKTEKEDSKELHHQWWWWWLSSSFVVQPYDCVLNGKQMLGLDNIYLFDCFQSKYLYSFIIK